MIALLAAAAAAAVAAQAAPPPRIEVTNGTRRPIRCMLMEGGPVPQLFTVKPGDTYSERLAPGAKAGLACPKVRDTVFGPVPAGRYVFRKVKGRVALVPATAKP